MGKDSNGSGLGCLAIPVGLAGLVASFSLGPIDLCRSVYNGIVGDTPVLKEQLVDYVRRDIARRNHSLAPADVESRMAIELNYVGKLPETGEVRLDSGKISIETLWNASEDHARSWYQRWIWPSIEPD